jgi:tetratricopeptide (TPR) repeat protein
MAPVQPKSRLHRLGSHVLACLAVAGCAATPPSLPEISPLAGQPAYVAEERNPLSLSPEMKAFVESWAETLQQDESPAWSLAYAAMDPYVLEFEYDPRITLTASEAFERKTGNCLTFSNLFIALAREAGLEAWYREVETLPEWSNVNDTALVSMHTNAAVRDRSASYVIDVSRRKPKRHEPVRRLSDLEAKAQYYNNLGADALIDQDLSRAFAWLVKALETWPEVAYVWSNLGVVYRRNGQADDAIQAYETALAIDSNHSVSLNNLYVMYEEQGELQKAEEMAARVERIRRRNPYYLLHLANVANEEQRYAEAEALLARAIRIDDSEFRLYRALAHTQYRRGDISRARANLEKARLLAPVGVDAASITLPSGPMAPDH